MRAVGAAASLAAVAGTAGCTAPWERTSSASPAPDAVPDVDQLRYYIGLPACIDPYNASIADGLQVVYQLFDPLTRYDYQTQSVTGLAALSYEVSDDARTFTFRLNSATFHDGTSVAAADFKRAWERVASPASAAAKAHGASQWSYLLSLVSGYAEVASGSATDLAGVTCPDERTLRVELSAPYADFPLLCAHPALSPVPASAEGDPDSFFKRPVGNGPFAMSASWQEGHNISLVRNEAYYRAGASIDGVLFSVLDSGDTAVKRFEAEALDVSTVYPAQATAMRDGYGVPDDGDTASVGAGVLLGPELGVYYLACNTKLDPLDTAVLRRAISLAIDRKAICDTVYRGTMLPANSIVPPGVQGRPEDGWAYVEHDEERANELLDALAPLESGSRGIRVTVSFSKSGGHEKVVDAIAASLKKMGIEVVEDKVEAEAIESGAATARMQLIRLDWTPDAPCLDAVLYPLFHSSSPHNLSAFADDEVDALLDQARSAVDDGQRIDLARQALDKVADDMPVIPLMYDTHRLVASKRVSRLYVDPAGFAHLAAAELDA